MPTLTASETDLVRRLGSLIELEHDAVAAYEAAISRLSDAEDRAQFRRFADDHREHVLAITTLVLDLGGTPPFGPDFKKLLIKGRVVLAGLISARQVLEAMRNNERDTNRAYERAVAHMDLPDPMRAVLERILAEERSHRAWIEDRLGRSGSLGVTAGSHLE